MFQDQWVLLGGAAAACLAAAYVFWEPSKPRRRKGQLMTIFLKPTNELSTDSVAEYTVTELIDRSGAGDTADEPESTFRFCSWCTG